MQSPSQSFPMPYQEAPDIATREFKMSLHSLHPVLGLFCFVLFCFAGGEPQVLQDPNSPTRDWTWPGSESSPSPNHWTAREFPGCSLRASLWDSGILWKASPAWVQGIDLHLIFFVPWTLLQNCVWVCVFLQVHHLISLNSFSPHGIVKDHLLKHCNRW